MWICLWDLTVLVVGDRVEVILLLWLKVCWDEERESCFLGFSTFLNWNRPFLVLHFTMQQNVTSPIELFHCSNSGFKSEAAILILVLPCLPLLYLSSSFLGFFHVDLVEETNAVMDALDRRIQTSQLWDIYI